MPGKTKAQKIHAANSKKVEAELTLSRCFLLHRFVLTTTQAKQLGGGTRISFSVRKDLLVLLDLRRIFNFLSAGTLKNSGRIAFLQIAQLLDITHWGRDAATSQGAAARRRALSRVVLKSQTRYPDWHRPPCSSFCSTCSQSAARLCTSLKTLQLNFRAISL